MIPESYFFLFTNDKIKKWEMKVKIISLYLTVFCFSKQKENMWECKIIIICEKLKNIMRKKIRNILINIFILHYYLLTLNVMPYKINRKILNLTSSIFNICYI